MYLQGNPLVSENINEAQHIKFLREYAKQYGLPEPKSSDIKNEKTPRTKTVDYNRLFQENPDLLQDWNQYSKEKNEWMKILPQEAIPYIEHIFRNTPEDMLQHTKGYLNRDNATEVRLQAAKQWLEENKHIQMPSAFKWKKYPDNVEVKYTKYKNAPFIDWDAYFKDNPHMQSEYEKFKQENSNSVFNDPRDMLNQHKNSPAYDSYINRETPINWQDTTNYIWSMPKEHQERITPYFIPYADAPDYGTPEEYYYEDENPDHGNSKAYISPENYGKGWMIHHSPNSEQIAQQGFQKGVTLQNANTLVKTDGGSGTPGFNYAFDAEKHENPMWDGGKAVIFPGHFLNIQHGRNDDNYVLFDGTEVPTEQIFPIVSEAEVVNGENKRGWSVYDASGRKVVDKAPLKEVIEWVKENNGMLQDVKKKQSSTS